MKTLFFAAAACLLLAANAAGFSLQSPDVGPKAVMATRYVYNRFGCQGQNVSPALVWKDPPGKTKSFALTVYDPDAGAGRGWWHWVMIDIPGSASSLARGAGDPGRAKAPKGAVDLRNDFGTPGWGGPCPPKGDGPHHYIFTLHALQVDSLPVPAGATAAQVSALIKANQIGAASFTVRYRR